uniref:Transposase n=1 Tax=Ditylenchus dipsaci TaxID=166011 RepID=A0A915E4D2_9BILA
MPKLKSSQASLYRQWISKFNNGEKVYSIDGKVIYCQACQKQLIYVLHLSLLIFRCTKSIILSQSFLEKNCKRNVPDESTLRKNDLKAIFNQVIDSIKAKVDGKYVWASVDETTDSQGRHATNLLIGTMNEEDQKPHLVATKFLEKVNNSTIARFVNDSLSLSQSSIENCQVQKLCPGMPLPPNQFLQDGVVEVLIRRMPAQFIYQRRLSSTAFLNVSVCSSSFLNSTSGNQEVGRAKHDTQQCAGGSVRSREVFGKRAGEMGAVVNDKMKSVLEKNRGLAKLMKIDRMLNGEILMK